MAQTLTKWSPMRELIELRSHLDRAFEDLGGAREGTLTPAVDVLRNGATLVVRAELPGIKPDEVMIEVEGDVLTISGRHEDSQEKKDDGGRYLRRERRVGAFARSIALPAGVDARQIKADVRDGILEVTVPLPETAGSEKVQITPTRAGADEAADGTPDGPRD